MDSEKRKPVLTLLPAEQGGFVVMDDTTPYHQGPGYGRVPAFAGDLERCLAFMQQQHTPPMTLGAAISMARSMGVLLD